MRDIPSDTLWDMSATMGAILSAMSIIFHIVNFCALMFLLLYLYHVWEGHRKLRTVGVECWQHTLGEEWLRTIGVEYLDHTRTLQ